eukprot:gene18683-20570_t
MSNRNNKGSSSSSGLSSTTAANHESIKKKGKDKSSGDLPPTGRSWLFKRSKSKNKNVEAVEEAVIPAEEEKQPIDNDKRDSSPLSKKHAATESVASGRQVQEQRCEPSKASDTHVSLSEDDLKNFAPLSAREQILYTDLQAVKAKCVQMEKTMRWWSDCTANWREKWGRVRAERNKLKDETRVLTGRNEALTRELTFLKREQDDNNTENQLLRNELNKCKLQLKRLDKEKRTAIVEPHVQIEGVTNGKIEVVGSDSHKSVYDSTIPKSGAEIQFLEQILDQKGVLPHAQDATGEEQPNSDICSRDLMEYEKAFGQKTRENIALRSQLEQMRRFIQEREQKYVEIGSLNETLQAEVAKIKDKTSDVNETSSVSDVHVSRVQDLKMKELRAEIERLQTENAEEWDKREQVETERQALEREVKRLKAQIEDLEEEIRKKTDQVAHAQTSAMKFLQEELENKSQELLELKLSHKRAQKQLQEKSDELEHEKKRTEQYEMEMKKLRGRVEELKKKLCQSEETADNQSNILRRLQRSMEEQTQHSDNLQAEITHLTSRLKRQSISFKSSKNDDNSDDDVQQI